MENLDNRSAQKKIIGSFFNRTSERWDNLYSGETFIDYHMRERKQIVLNLVEEYSNGSKLKILDLGCGPGSLTRELLKNGHTLVGADIAEELIRKLNSSINTQDRNKYLGSVMCDAGTISFDKETFDVVLCIGVLQYQLRDDIILREIARVLNRNGICIATFPNLLRLNYFFDPISYLKFLYRITRKGFYKLKLITKKNDAEAKRLTGTFQNYYPYDKKYYFGSIKKIINENEFDIVKVVSFGYGPFTIFKKEIFPDLFSLYISTTINRLVSKTKLNLFNYIANRWVCAAKKRDDLLTESSYRKK